jgi:hypothetical protein
VIDHPNLFVILVGLFLLFLAISMVQALISKLRGDEPIRTSNLPLASNYYLEPDTNSRRGNWQPYLEIGYKLAWIVGAVTFGGAYIYCVVTYGFLLGMGLGWLPSGILAFIVGVLTVFLWLPAIFAALLVGAYIITTMSS